MPPTQASCAFLNVGVAVTFILFLASTIYLELTSASTGNVVAVISSIDGESVRGSSETVSEKSSSSSSSSDSSSSSIGSETTTDDTVIVPEHLKQIWNNEYPVAEAIPPGYAFAKVDYVPLDKLRMCEASKGGPKQHSIKCEEDPTCMKCIKEKAIMRARKVKEALQDAQKKKKREKLYRSWAKEGSSVVLIAADNKFIDFVLNFNCLVKAKGFGVSDSIIVLATDPEAASRAEAHGMNVLTFEMFGVSLPLASGFTDTMVAVTAAVADLVSFGYSVCLQDADVVWLQNPLWMLNSTHFSQIDIQFQMAPRWDAQGVANTGFVLLRPTPKTRIFTRTLVEISELYYFKGDDQIVWNSLLRHWHFAQLHWQILPRASAGADGKLTRGRFFDLHTTNGKDGTAKWIDEGTLVLHTVSSTAEAKRTQMEKIGVWFLAQDGRSCTMP
mmetsp:Transcript_1359/g.2291  ORF Transcript_1359/g.2291 Transcript_1359/m.2291 type:complete len:443 (+) Transcript_1359:131-1459(+)|eukprot:CAMPEP_0197522392 /NCGR_PEP_ID=MMETSP1318-20131121/7559_1 /TAXON_ID=552666 /ORGANISM="Partenskyella glossopodia, Strain RCC365" /LENGTH=442 /DNA_ID=CAMNT_0043074771 /DNA_START=116 /DNA_END=1444 /DNA_ORIENTATION=+